MVNFRRIEGKLQKLGLSKNQASVYLCLARYGNSRIQEVVNLTQIPRSSVYESLKGLYELGIAEEIEDNHFKRIRPYPIGAMRHRLDEKLSSLQGLIKDLENLEKAIALAAPSSPPAQTVVRYYKGRSGARQLFWNTLKSKSTVHVYSEYGRSKFLGKKFYMDFVRESYARNIKEMVLINPTSRALKLIKRDTGSPIARTDIKSIRFLKREDLVIKGETFIYDNVFAEVYLDERGINGFEIESSDFTQTQRSIFETLWAKAQPIALLL